ncbi:MAG: metal-dependent transcriptional regulator [Candidatus Lindowbacteria bacterium]|nr:metal-dependent transcriptional regulator [Candidatus Lindowbacteria bacterium]
MTKDNDSRSYSDVWRCFEEQTLTHSMAHYILAIAECREEHGYARAVDVAKRLGVTKGSTSIALRAMKEKGYVGEDKNRMLLLTDQGQAAFSTIVNARTTFLRFFRDVLGIEENSALEDACKLEHLVSRFTSERLFRFVGFMQMDPTAGILVQEFKHYVGDCNAIDDCKKCVSIEECTTNLVTRRETENKKIGKKAVRKKAK